MSMDRIEKYIKSLSKDVYLSPKELADLQEEIRTHLVDTVKELQRQGKSMEESVTIALSRFGAEKFINTELRRVVRFQSKFRNSMLKVSGVFLLISLLFLMSSFFLTHRNTTEYDSMQSQYHNQIGNRIMTDGAISMEEVEIFFNQNERILRFVHLVETDHLERTTEYIYPANTAQKQVNDQPYILYPAEYEDARWEAKIGLKRDVLFTKTPEVMFILAIICFVVYWILYGLWNIMNAYQMGRLNVVWAVLFFTLNVFAYLLFKLEEKLKKRRLEDVA